MNMSYVLFGTLAFLLIVAGLEWFYLPSADRMEAWSALGIGLVIAIGVAAVYITNLRKH